MIWYPRFSHLGRALAIAGLASAVLLQGPATAAHAADNTDLLINVTGDDWANPGGAVRILAGLASTQPNVRASARILVPNQFANVSVASAPGFSCGITQDQVQQVWAVTCTKPSMGQVEPGGSVDDIITISATAPSSGGPFKIRGTVSAVNIPDTNMQNNSDQHTVTLKTSVQSKPRIPSSRLTKP